MSRILVVGGGSGIGEHVTKFLVGRHGAKVVVLGLHITEDIRQLAREERVRFVQGDATTDDIQKQAFQMVSDYLSGLDALVITQGVLGEIETVGKLDVEQMRRAFEVNFFTPVQLTQQYLPYLRKSNGRIIILSSAVDQEILYSGWAPYCSSKAALSRFIQVLGHEEDQVHVFGIYPGLTRTPMVTDLVAGKFQGKMKDSEIEKFRTWDKEGGVEPAEWSANVTAKLAAAAIGGKGQGESRWYYEYCKEYEDYKA